MSLVFRWYLGLSSFWANAGVADRALDYQVWCGPAIGSYNEFIAGTYLDPAVAQAFPDVHESNTQLPLTTGSPAMPDASSSSRPEPSAETRSSRSCF